MVPAKKKTSPCASIHIFRQTWQPKSATYFEQYRFDVLHVRCPVVGPSPELAGILGIVHAMSTQVAGSGAGTWWSLNHSSNGNYNYSNLTNPKLHDSLKSLTLSSTNISKTWLSHAAGLNPHQTCSWHESQWWSTQRLPDAPKLELSTFARSAQTRAMFRKKDMKCHKNKPSVIQLEKPKRVQVTAIHCPYLERPPQVLSGWFFFKLRSQSLLKQSRPTGMPSKEPPHTGNSVPRPSDPTFQMATAMDQNKNTRNGLVNAKCCSFSMLKHPFWGWQFWATAKVWKQTAGWPSPLFSTHGLLLAPNIPGDVRGPQKT